MILDSSQLRKNIARIECGNNQGTAFLISEKIAITALHCIEDYTEDDKIILQFLNITENIITINAKAIEIDLSNEIGVDIAILELEEKISGFENLSFENSIISEKSIWNTFGYPASERNDGLPIEGIVSQKKMKYNVNDFDLILEYNGQNFNTDGLSGSPVIINGKVQGIITYDKDNRNLLGAFSIDKIIPLLEKVKIKYSNIILDTQENDVIGNYSTEYKLIDCIKKNKCGYIFVKGVPGSGKTTLANNLNFNEENIEIINKYFLKEINEKYNVGYKASEEVFGKWFINSISKFLYGSLIEEKNYTYKELVENSNNYFSNFCDYVAESKKKFVFIIDGIDEVCNLGKENIELFLGLLPKELKTNIFIILFGNNENNFPMYIKEKLPEEKIVNVLPLGKEEVTTYIQEKLKNKNISYEHIQLIVKKSEGNPLYVNYLINYFNNFPDDINFDFINNIPAFDGEITNYYKSFWEKIKSESALIKILGILSRIRNKISKLDLIQMFSNDEKYLFENNFLRINHLINGNENLSIYHNSFSDFIKRETLAFDSDIHHIISEFCLNNLENVFSIENILYHLINAKIDDKKEAIKRCNQDWMDRCTFENIHPDIILIDAKNVLEFSIENENVAEVIKILLLLQRLKFRNEKMFRKYSFEVSKALFEIDKKEFALNYIIRDGVLIENIESDEAIYLLRKFILNDLHKDANLLFEAIHNRCIKELENYENGISIKTILTDIESIALFPEYNVFYRIKFYDEMLTYCGFDEKEAIIRLLKVIPTSFIMWSRDKYLNIKSLEERGIEVQEDSIDLIFKIIMFYNENEKIFYKKRENKSIFEAVKDLEFLINKFEKYENIEVLEVLIERSNNIDLLEKLISNIKSINFLLRKENGVDFNFDSFFKFKNYWSYLGYIDKGESYPKIEKIIDWENYIVSIIKLTAFIRGKCLRIKAEDKSLKLVEKKLEGLLDSLNFSLKERVKWDRSYFIPEKVFPLIFREITNIYLSFFNQSLDGFIYFLLEKYQLGVYNEGYRRILFNASEEIIKFGVEKRKAFPIIKTLDEFIENNIQNRWERTRDFLQIIEMYGMIDCKEKAKSVFKKMLKTSMGPSWYKEAQFTLMNTGINSLLNLPNKEKYLKEIISHLDFASGEMTFQRYVRDEKEELVGVITKVLGVHKGLEYFKTLIFPNNNILLKNINQNKLDFVESGDGYVQGTGEVDLQDAIEYFLDELDEIDLVLKYVISDIFIQGDERYFDNYINIQLNILEKIKANSDEEYRIIIERIKYLFVAELDDNRREIYLKNIRNFNNKDISEELFQEIENLNLLNIQNKNKEMESIVSLKEEEENSKIIYLIESEIEYENIENAKEILKKEINKITENGFNVFNYSKESLKYLQLMKNICNTGEEILKNLKKVFLNTVYTKEDKNYTEEWFLVNDAIKLIGNKLEEKTSTEIMDTILEHIDLLIRTPREVKEKYKWIEDETNNTKDNNTEVIKFIIWLTNLPNGMIYKKRAIESLVWLSEKKPLILIPLLVDEALKCDNLESNEISSNIIHIISQTKQLENLWYYIYNDKKIQKEIIEIKHFSIKSCFFEAIKEAKNKMLYGAENFYNELKEVFFDDSHKLEISNAKMNLDFNWCNSEIKYILNELSQLINVNTEFINLLEESIKEKIAPYRVDEYKQIEKYIERSYSVDKLSGKFNYVVKFCINLLVSKYIKKSNYNEIKILLRRYNPLFPDRYLSFDKVLIFDKIKKIFEKKSNDYQDCFLYDDKIILHYNEMFENKEKNKGDRIEIISFLIENIKEIPVPDEKLYDYFTSNMDYEDVKIEMESYDGIFPLVLKNVFNPCDCSWYTPSEIHPKAKERYDISEKDIEKKVWRFGRTLNEYRFGMPQNEGCLLTIDINFLQNIESKYRLMQLVFFNDSNYLIIDSSRHSVYGG